MNARQMPSFPPAERADLIAERDRLKAVNAELVAALEQIAEELQQSNGGKGPTGGLTTHLLTLAHAAINKAKRGE